MALFNFGKKKEEKKEAECACNASADTSSCCCGGNRASEEKRGHVDGNTSIQNVKVLGAGCKSCHAQYENAKEAVKAMGLALEVEYITDMQKVMEYGVMSMPALVVNEKVVAMGKVLNPADVEKMLRGLDK